VIPALLDISFVQLAHTRIDLPLVLIAVLVPDLLLTIAVALMERRPRYLLFAPAFLMLRVVDAAIGLYALPMAWAERSTGSWISPQRRRVVVAESVEVEPYAFAADVPADDGAADDGAKPVPVVRAVARVPVPYAVGDRNVERFRGVVRLADVLLASPERASGPGAISPVAAPDAVPVRVRGRASVTTRVPGAPAGPKRDPSAVVSGRAAVHAVNRLRNEHWSAVGVPGVTVVTAEAVEKLVGVAARQVAGVTVARASVGRPLAALTRGGDQHPSAEVLMHPDGRTAHVVIALGIADGFPTGAVIQNVRGAVLLALRSLLDVEVASVNIVVQDVVSDHSRLLPVMRRTSA
jgi:uncharacterized alkaline shock family protein YloU